MLFILALFDTDSAAPSLQTFSLSIPFSSSLAPHSLWTPPFRISSLSTFQSLVAASTLSGSLHVLDSSSLELLLTVEDREFHAGAICGVDLMESGNELVSVDEDGRVNLVSVGGGEKGFRRVYDGSGLVRFNAVKWASPTEFVTVGYGFGLQWWDMRRPGSPVS